MQITPGCKMQNTLEIQQHLQNTVVAWIHVYNKHSQFALCFMSLPEKQ